MSNLKQVLLKRVLVSGFCLASSLSLSAQITISLKNQSTRDVIREIERVSDYRFFFNVGLSDLDKRISIDVKDSDIQSVMSEIERQTSISYVIKENNQVVLMDGSDDLPEMEPRQAIKRLVTGAVFDMRGEPVIGANVMVKGTRLGAVTDMDGRFALEVPEGATLQISYIGYIDQSVEVGQQTVLKITLEEDAQALDEVVVVGYGAQKKVNLTGAVSSVKMEALEDRPVTNATNALAGVAAGLMVSNSGGSTPGYESQKIRIRGQGTLNNSDPLIVIDGMTGLSISDINPQDIENISVLKDAASHYLYGKCLV